ncbi:MAG: arsenosugar biosynthesis radical SAM protein ArsS [Deltaproteobacteria bacterium]|nr:arsenosugar biosynthesis radical SAM protein ArsS [Deltaproteobacteria bacterium]
MKSLPTLSARRDPLASPEHQRATLRALPIAEFGAALAATGAPPLRPARLETFQINVGKLCNQTCRHCHVDAGPDRREVMSRETMEQCLAALDRTPTLRTVDVTGGAPELHPHFRWFVDELRARDLHVIDRCNLTILETPSHRELPAFFAQRRVEVVCSLPHWAKLNSDAQRGDGVYDASIRALRRLNEAGYGDGRSGLRLVLVTNPAGAFLPAGQVSLEREWRRELERRHGVRFDALYTITNMPISRYLEWLQQSGNLEGYMERLVHAFNPRAAEAVMCRSTISVGWDGTLYDCDFNQMLDMRVEVPRPHVRDFDLDALATRTIAIDRHCFGCTAGAGSSCGGAIT